MADNLNVVEEMIPRLARWASAHHGPTARVEAVYPMPGNSGISYGFDVLHHTGGVEHREALVIRVPPPGVRRQGNTDVLRQVPLLRALAEEGVPVPRLHHWGEDETCFGVPYLVVERVPGCALNVFDTDPSFVLTPVGVRPLFRQALGALAQIHRLDWRRRLPDWSHPRTLGEEIAAWEPVLGKALDPDWVAQGLDVRDRLLKYRPAEPPPGLFHGDFFSNNWMFDDGRLHAVIDWEISGIGPSLLDLGWVCMWYDAESWGPARQPAMAWAPPAEELVAMYEEAAGRPAEDIGWYRALAGYRFGAITAINVRLHRTGRRPDPVWDVLAESFPYLLDRARQLLDG